MAIPFSSRVEREGAPVGLWLLALSLVGIRIGAAVIAFWRKTSPVTACSTPRMSDPWAQRVLLAATLLTLTLAFVSGAASWHFVRSHSYAEYYTTDTSILPMALDILGAAAFAMVACYLAQFPRDRTYRIVLAAYLMSTVPALAMGLRSPFMGAVVLVAAYSILRWRLLGGVKARVPVVAIVVAVLAIPVGMAGLGALNYARFDKSSTSGLDPVTDFVFSQSVSYTVVSRGFTLYTELPDHANRHYSIGGLTDYVLYGKPAQVLVGASPWAATPCATRPRGTSSHMRSRTTCTVRAISTAAAQAPRTSSRPISTGGPGVLSYSLLLGALVMFLGVGFTRSWLAGGLHAGGPARCVPRPPRQRHRLSSASPITPLLDGGTSTALVRWAARGWRGPRFTPAHAPVTGKPAPVRALWPAVPQWESAPSEDDRPGRPG